MRNPRRLVWWALGGSLLLWSVPCEVHADSQSQTVQVMIIIPERRSATLTSSLTNQNLDSSHAAPVQPFIPPANIIPTLVRDGSAPPHLVYTYTEPN